MLKQISQTKLTNNSIFIQVTFMLFILVSACTKPSTSTVDKLVKDSQFAFGVSVDIKFYGDVRIMRSNKALIAINNDFEHLQTSWNPWGNMAMARANKLIKTTEWFSYNPSINRLLLDGQKISKTSNGLFNPTLGKITHLWGFDSYNKTPSSPPTNQQINLLLSQTPSMNNITVKGVRIKSNNPDIVFDFNAMVKGLAVEIVMDNIKQFNINNAMINIGETIKVIGKNNTSAWKVNLRHPRNNQNIFAYIKIHSMESISTSADYFNYFIYNGNRYHNIIDPRTGYPATDTMSVTVIAPDASLANAAATALFIAGPSNWYDTARSMAIKYVLLIDKNETIHMNPAMKNRINFHQPLKNLLISKEL